MKHIMTNNVFKTVFLFTFYLFYTYIITEIFSYIHVNQPYSVFIADIIFLLVVILFYKETIKKDSKDFNKDYVLKKKLKIIFGYVLILFLVNVLGGIISELIYPNMEIDSNTNLLWNLSNISLIYTLFKTFIFSAVAEELLFKTAVRNIIENKKLFIVVSAFMYAFMNIVYGNAELTSTYLILDLISYFVFSAILSINYVKYNNIIFIMIIKAIYNFIPIAIMFVVGMGNV